MNIRGVSAFLYGADDYDENLCSDFNSFFRSLLGGWFSANSLGKSRPFVLYVVLLAGLWEDVGSE